MVTHTNDNFFKYYPNAIRIFLVDKTFSKSGQCLKNFYYREPEHWDELAAKAKKFPLQIGSAIKTNWGVTIVARNHYASKWDAATVEQVWQGLLPILSNAANKLHIDIEDYPWLADIIEHNDLPQTNIVIHHHSEWEWGENYD